MATAWISAIETPRALTPSERDEPTGVSLVATGER